MNTQKCWVITATPPTPNGDLHVGHLSGPYLGADIFCRARKAIGDTAVYFCYGDDNQSYVETTASRLGVDALQLARDSNGKIQETLSAFDILTDEYATLGQQHTVEIQKTVAELTRRGALLEVEEEEPFDIESGRSIFESYLTGRCSVCLSITKCGICEGCGHPNRFSTLLQPTMSENADAELAIRVKKKLVLRVENYRGRLTNYIDSKRGRWRPHIIELADQLLSEPLADFDMSFHHTWGLPLGMPEWEGHVLNVWAEMGIGLSRLAQRHGFLPGEHEYAQFLGYDNSYFFLIVHPALHFALEDAGGLSVGLADFIFTNEFYNLDGRKFSTSQGHLIWGRELLEHMCSDRARYYLALHGPELAESNFVLNDALEDVAEKLDSLLSRILEHIETSADSTQPKVINDGSPKILDPLHRRYRYYCHPENFSASKLARITYELLLFIADEWPRGDDLCELGDHLAALRLWAELADPLMPSLSAKVVPTLSGATGLDCGRLIVVLREFLDEV